MSQTRMLIGACIAAFVVCAVGLYLVHGRTQQWNAGLILLAVLSLLGAAALAFRRP